jgi:hypothetical protein
MRRKTSKQTLTRYGLFVALLSLVLAQTRPALAADYVQVLRVGGLSSGQTLRIGVANKQKPGDRQSQPFQARVVAYNGCGDPIMQTDPVTVAPGETQSFNFIVDDLPSLKGNDGTFKIFTQNPTQDAETLRLSAETLVDLVENSTGKTATVFPRPSMNGETNCWLICAISPLACVLFCLTDTPKVAAQPAPGN